MTVYVMGMARKHELPREHKDYQKGMTSVYHLIYAGKETIGYKKTGNKHKIFLEKDPLFGKRVLDSPGRLLQKKLKETPERMKNLDEIITMAKKYQNSKSDDAIQEFCKKIDQFT